jgi:hypothetical protein
MKSVRKITFYTCIGLGLVIAVVLIIFAHNIIEPVTTTNITTPTVAVQQVSPPVQVKGKYASFSYPGSLKPAPGATSSGLGSYSYTKVDIESWQLEIEINELSQPSLSADTGYVLRENDPSRYQATTVVNGKNTFIIMSDTQAGGFSKVAFSLDGDKSVDISLIGDDPSGNAALANTFREVLQSWQWL